jgi:hypothetical protein
MQVPVYIESGAKRVFACALEWPGWCRSGRDETDALSSLALYAPRYAMIARDASEDFDAADLAVTVVDRISGSATTDFGAPDSIPAGDWRGLDDLEARRILRLLNAAWLGFDRIVSSAPSELRKGPRGGGRDRDKVVAHVSGAEAAYAGKIGARLGKADRSTEAQREAIRRALLSGAGSPKAFAWPVAYAARRIAWHVLDHAWEIEDRAIPV